LKIYYFDWCGDFLEHIELRHSVQQYEIRQIFANNPKIRKDGKSRKYPGEYRYLAHGKTDGDRYLRVVFIYKKNGRALIISAFDV
jgi:uncharacterized DUF497 family protein